MVDLLVQRLVWRVLYHMVKVIHTLDADFNGKKKQYSDIKGVENVEDLFFEFLRVAKDIKPKLLLVRMLKV